MSRICNGTGEFFEEHDEYNYIKDPTVICNHNCILIKCKNYILCDKQFPCWAFEELCDSCNFIFGEEVKINNNIKCNNCLKISKCLQYFNDILCIECSKKLYYYDSDSDLNEQDSVNLIEIENSMYDRYKSSMELSTCLLNNKQYIIDKVKLENLNSILPFELNKVKLKKSNIHGYGVFAKRKIFKNELITFYPGDIVEYHPNADNNITLSYTSKRYENKFGKNIHDDIFKKYRNNDFAYDINDQYTIIGCSYFTDNPNYLGHYINDGGKTNSTEKSNEIYMKITNIKRNCDFYSLKDLHIAIIAMKDIEIEDELFIRYGIEYWDSYNKNTII